MFADPGRHLARLSHVSTRNTGARVIPDLRTRAVAPPALRMVETPRLT